MKNINASANHGDFNKNIMFSSNYNIIATILLQTRNEFVIILLLTKKQKLTYWLLLNASAQFIRVISRHLYIDKTVRFDKSFEPKVQAQIVFTSKKIIEMIYPHVNSGF